MRNWLRIIRKYPWDALLIYSLDLMKYLRMKWHHSYGTLQTVVVYFMKFSNWLCEKYDNIFGSYHYKYITTVESIKKVNANIQGLFGNLFWTFVVSRLSIRFKTMDCVHFSMIVLTYSINNSCPLFDRPYNIKDLREIFCFNSDDNHQQFLFGKTVSRWYDNKLNSNNFQLLSPNI